MLLVFLFQFGFIAIICFILCENVLWNYDFFFCIRLNWKPCFAIDLSWFYFENSVAHSSTNNTGYLYNVSWQKIHVLCFSKVQHPNIIQLHGVVLTSEPTSLILVSFFPHPTLLFIFTHYYFPQLSSCSIFRSMFLNVCWMCCTPETWPSKMLCAMLNS